MPVAPRVTILNIDRLVLFSTIRAWASGMIFVGAIALLAHSFLLYATDFRFASALYGWVILAYAALAAGVGGFKASVTISAAATAVLIGLLVVDTELIKGQDPLALIFVDVLTLILALVIVIAVILCRAAKSRVSGPNRFRAASVPMYRDQTAARAMVTMPIFRAKLAILAALAGLAALVVVAMTTSDVESILGALCILPLLQVVRMCVLRSRRLQAVAARELATLDLRKPIIFLRSFYDDYIVASLRGLKFEPVESTAVIHWENVPLAEKLISFLAREGPVITVGQPGELEPPLGAAREYIPDNEDWRTAVRRKMQEAKLIVVMAGQSPGLALELDAIRQDEGLLEKTIFIVPSVTPGESLPGEIRGEQSAAERATFVLNALGRTWGETGVKAENVRGFYFDGKALVVVASEFDTAASVLNGIQALMTYVPEPRAKDSDGRTEAFALVGGRHWVHKLGADLFRINLLTAVLIVLSVPLLLLANFIPIIGRFSSDEVRRLEAFMSLNGGFGLAGVILFSSFLKLNGRYATGRDSLEEIFKRVAGSGVPVFAILLATLLATLIFGLDPSELLVPRRAGGVLAPFAGIALLATALMGTWRLAVNLKRLWGTSLADVAINVALSLVACVGLCFAGWFMFSKYAEEAGKSSPAPANSFQAGLQTKTKMRLYAMAVEADAQLPASAQVAYCLALGFDERNPAFVWHGSLPRWNITMGGYPEPVIFCIAKPVPLSVLLLAERESRWRMTSWSTRSR